MLSRVANSIYWMCRYMERAESYARLIDANQRLILDLPADVPEQWNPIVETTGDQQRFTEQHEEFDKDSVFQFMGLDRENPNSIVSSLSYARENARTIREVISSEMWFHINQVYWEVQKGLAAETYRGNLSSGLIPIVKSASQSFAGIMDSTMSHGTAWLFGTMGRFLERSDQTARILDIKYYYLLPSVDHVNSPLDLLQWSALLKSAGAMEMYLKQFGTVNFDEIVSFLALDKNFPRSILHCLKTAEGCLHEITGSSSPYSTPPERELGRLRSRLEYMDIVEIKTMGLHEFIDWFQLNSNRISESIFDQFFAQNKKAVAETSQ
ncbi:MAG: alpha-E domain-containing protein [Okeania sp. SIO1H5]|uniref:alpha-E domain-containing protein n=1 Tax=Okeania sp. SIO1H5 TaxID=2607777 RepID=UPI0013BD67C1|nr:alpha-E domain-containing protein [Okeania sp. SIO1H5]NET23634.1 alpha-E domain-containing protein [Okeania sp. SIO1H5]